MVDRVTEKEIMRNKESVNTLLRTTTSIGENFEEAMILLADRSGGEHVREDDLTAMRAIVDRLRARAEQAGYIGKGNQ